MCGLGKVFVADTCDEKLGVDEEIRDLGSVVLRYS